MTAVQPDQVRRVSIVGAGVIGGGWALHYLRTGFDVDVYDPSPAAYADLRRMVEASWPLLDRMGLREGASPDQVNAEFTRFLATTPEEFASQAAVVAERTDALAAAGAIGPRPLLVVHGTADWWVPVAQARELRERAGSSCRYVEVEGADHAFSWHRAELADLMLGWLRGLTG